MRNVTFWIRLAVLNVLLVLGTVTVSAQYLDEFDTDPFAGTVPRWATAGTGANASIAWSTAQFLPGRTHSVELVRTNGFDNNLNPRLSATISGVPQTGIVTVSFYTYFTVVPSEITHINMKFGDTSVNGPNPMFNVGLFGGSILAGSGYPTPKITTFSNGNWDSANYASLPTMPTNTWVKHRIVCNQDALTFDYYLTIGASPEVTINTGRPMGQKMGAPGFNTLVSGAYAAGTYYFADFELSGGGISQPESLIYSPLGDTDTFSTDPFDPFTPRWTSQTGGVGTVTRSTAQALPGRTHSMRIERTGGLDWNINPRLFTNLTNVPQTGKVELEYYNYFETIPDYITHIGMKFGDSGQAGANPMFSSGLLGGSFWPGAGSPQYSEPGHIVSFYNGNWEGGDLASTYPVRPVHPINQWVRHRIIVDQDAMTFDYKVKIGAGPETVIASGRPAGQKLGAPGFLAAVTGAYTPTIYYIGDVTLRSAIPGVKSISSVDGSTIDVTFSKPMGATALTASNYTVSGPGKGTLANNPDSVTQLSDYIYRLSWNSGSQVNGSIVTITAAPAVQDADGGTVVATSNDSASVAAVPVQLSGFDLE